ncbi:MAG: hypothetical protein HZA78_01195 [Candidatus Schekmanbacteria bacterium]|nr:hypothetical protein [Candidatus Schekmanbacteria bacterium]
MLHKIIKTTLIPGTVEDVFQFHTSLEIIFGLLPAHVKITKLHAPDHVKLGDKVRLFIRIHALFFPWEAVIAEFQQNERFVDVLEHGPFSYWRHEHLFLPQDDSSTLITDQIEYKLKFSLFGELASHLFLEKELTNIFNMRHQKALEYFFEKRHRDADVF